MELEDNMMKLMVLWERGGFASISSFPQEMHGDTILMYANRSSMLHNYVVFNRFISNCWTMHRT